MRRSFEIHTLAMLALAGLCLGAPVARAGQPSSGDDITGKKVYLATGARLRFDKNLIGRVYTRATLPLELNGAGKCTLLFCPVTHNKIELYASRLRLDTTKPSGTVLTDRTLRRGDEGEDVKAIQMALIKKGVTVDTDGKYGRKTELAVSAFQKKSGVEPDGAVGPKTRQLLGV
jgi:Putative peptidoglycan binding domain